MSAETLNSSAESRLAIVGRPNVGKSTLFNRLVGHRQALVHDLPGVTRDRLYGRAELDDQHTVEVVDTGGLMIGEDPWGLWDQIVLAVEESDLLLLVVDGAAGVVSADEEVLTRLRPFGKPIVLVVNKSDTREARERQSEFHRLGIEPVIVLSAEHGRGIEELRQQIVARLPEPRTVPAPVAPAIAIVGRPNVGKSSLLNRLLGTSRALVSAVAGTTRDPIDTLLERGGKSYLLIDTAGIRRRSRITNAPDELAVLMSKRQIGRAQVAILVIDAQAGVTTGDLSIAGEIFEQGRGALVVVNKWDLLDADSRKNLDLSYERLDEILARPPRVNISALSGRGVEKILRALDGLIAAHGLRLETSAVNKIFEEAIRRHKPPSDRSGRPWKLYYATQVSSGPPTFLLFANRPLPRDDGFRRYLQNQLRDQLELGGVPLRLVVRQRQ
jgi:GTPase